MKPRYRLSRDAVELIERFEGFRRKAARLDGGGWTVGFGHTKTAREGAVVSREDAEALLLYDLIGVSHAVNERVFTPLTQNQFDALVAFAFSIGVANFENSAVLRRVNEGQLLAASYAMEMWRKAVVAGEMIVVDALVRRRAAEKALFLTPPDGLVPSPSPVLPPNLDYDLITAAPRETPVVVKAPLEGDQAAALRAERPPPPAPRATAAEAAAAALATQLEGLLPEEEVAPPVEAVQTPAAAVEPQELGPSLGDLAPAAELLVEPTAEPIMDRTAEVEAEAEAEDEAETEAGTESLAGDPTPVEVEAQPEPAVESDFALTPAPENEPAAVITAVESFSHEVDEPQLFDAPPHAAWTGPVAAADRLAADMRTFPREDLSDFNLTRDDVIAGGMLVFGLLLLAGGLRWATVRTPVGGILVNSASLGWVVGLIGLIVSCIGAYRLFLRLLEAKDQNDGL